MQQIIESAKGIVLCYQERTPENNSKCNTFEIVMDNLNIYQKASHKTLEENKGA